MKTNHFTELTFSLHTNKGVYALLLGSGVSRSAGIATGWEITIDLAKKLSIIADGTEAQSPEKWFQEKYNVPLTYSAVIDRLGKTPSERLGILNTYIEPSAEDNEVGSKNPTLAHKAIARLVKQGIIKVILTTNFDRLIEKALEEIGISPTVISSADSTEGATPLIHSTCTVIKIHGDYKDTRIKNTIEELNEYDVRIESLLSKIFDEFGLIICGWSAEWDFALRTQIEKTKGRRYQTYWATRHELSGHALSLAETRSAKQILIPDADNFFEIIEDKIDSLKKYDSPHPLSPELAVIELKKYIVEDRFRIKLFDLCINETNKVCNRLNAYLMSGSIDTTGKGIDERLNSYFEDLSLLMPIFVNGVIWGENKHEHIWIRVLSNIANCRKVEGGYVAFNDLRLFPASLLLYSAGISLIYHNKYQTLLTLLTKVKIQNSDKDSNALSELPIFTLTRNDWMKQLPNRDREYTPLNNKVYEQLLTFFVPQIMTKDEFEQTFDRFEIMLAMLYSFFNSEDERDYIWSPPGRFSWKENSVITKLENEIKKDKNNWPPISNGLFESKYENALNMCTEVKKFKNKLGFRW